VGVTLHLNANGDFVVKAVAPKGLRLFCLFSPAVYFLCFFILVAVVRLAASRGELRAQS
jgi:hypothetical protein